MNTRSRSNFALFMRCKRKDLKWCQRFWNYITGHKDRNWHWFPINDTLENGSFNE